MLYFGHQDALTSAHEKSQRHDKLRRAMAISASERQLISLFLRLPSGETVETQSNLIEFADDFVRIKGGYCIPVRVIVDVDA